MLRLPRFTLVEPRTVADAVRARADAGPDAMYVAGGTDLWPNMKRRQQTPRTVIALSRIPELCTAQHRGLEVATQQIAPSFFMQ